MALSGANLISSTLDFNPKRGSTHSNIATISWKIGIFKKASYAAGDTKSMVRRVIMFNCMEQAESNAIPYPYWIRGAGSAAGASKSGGEYRVFIMVPNVNVRMMKSSEYHVQLSKGKYIRPISLSSKEIKVRCDCHDFRWRFAYYDDVHKALYGATPPPYVPVSNRGPVNPRHLPGMCKHLMAALKTLHSYGYFK